MVLAGIRCPTTRREALSTDGLQDKPINEIIAFVEGREMSNKAVSNEYSSLSATSCKRERIGEEGNQYVETPLDECSSLAATSTFKR